MVIKTKVSNQVQQSANDNHLQYKVAIPLSRYWQAALGSMYYYGKGVAQDHKEAAKWIKTAADQGLSKAVKSLEFIPDTVNN